MRIFWLKALIRPDFASQTETGGAPAPPVRFGDLICIGRQSCTVLARLLQQKLGLVLFERFTCGLIAFQTGLRLQLREEIEDLVALAVTDAFE